MATTKTGYANGSDLLVKIGGKAYGHCTTFSVTMTSDTKERSVKPVESAPISQALWKAKGVTGLSLGISAEGLRSYEETEHGLVEAAAEWQKGQSVDVECVERESATPWLKGKFIISSVEITAPAQDDTTYKLELENDGAPQTFDSTKLTQTAAAAPALGH